MLLSRIAVTSAISHHCQDTPENCGRACAQMVISSLVQSPGPGNPVAVPANTTPVPVTQATLQYRELDKFDNTLAPSWYTHPDELVDLMNNAPELQMPFLGPPRWRVANHATEKELLADISLALQRGMPSILNLKESDHWVVVFAADVEATGANAGRIQVLEMLDPLPFDPRAHTYVDGCSDGSNGWTYENLVIDRLQFGNFSLQVGKTPPPAGMTDYENRFVAIIHDRRPNAVELTDFIKRFMPVRVWRKPGPPVINPAFLLGQLRSSAESWGAEPLVQLLDTHGVPTVRLVSDIDGSDAQYTLLSIFDHDKKRGAITAFEPTEAVPMHVRFIKDPRIDQSLRSDSDQTLWWSPRWVPQLSSPYFPYRRRIVSDHVVYGRLFDDYQFNLPLPNA
jgi:hypothetical protein